jgi:hypothetical protein
MMMNPSNGMFMLSGSFLGTCDFDPSSNVSSLTSAGQSDAYIARFVQCAAITETVEAGGCGSYDFNGTVYTQSGTYEHILTSVGGCDSIVTLNLTIHGDSFSNVQLYAIDEIEYNGQVYTEEGDYVQTTENVFGCDSLIYINVDIMGHLAEVNKEIPISGLIVIVTTARLPVQRTLPIPPRRQGLMQLLYTETTVVLPPIVSTLFTYQSKNKKWIS